MERSLLPPERSLLAERLPYGRKESERRELVSLSVDFLITAASAKSFRLPHAS